MTWEHELKTVTEYALCVIFYSCVTGLVSINTVDELVLLIT